MGGRQQVHYCANLPATSGKETSQESAHPVYQITHDFRGLYPKVLASRPGSVVPTSFPKAGGLMSLPHLYHVYRVEVDDELKWQAGGRPAEIAGLGVTSA